MVDKLANITRWILYVLLAFVFVSGILFYTNNLSEDSFISLSRLLLILGVIIMFISPIYTFITHPKNVVKLLVSLAVFVIIIIIAYSMSTNTFSALRLEELNVTEGTSKLVGTGLYVTYTLFGLAVLAAIYASIIKVFK
jgi:hypothetical protein